MVSKYISKRCDICQNYLVCKNEFTCTVTSKIYKVRGKLCCTSFNAIYLISCKLFKEQYVGSAFKDSLKPRFRVHKSNVITGKNRFALTKCTYGNKAGKTLTFNWFNKCKRVTVTLKVSCGVEKVIGKPNVLLYLTKWIVSGTAIIPKEKAIEKTNSYSLCYIFIIRMLLVYISVLLEFLLRYLAVQIHPKFRSCMRFV